jgi:Ca-activated chloride channel family protein
MKRFSALALGFWLVLLSLPAYGQGLLIVVNPSEPVPLPRPIFRPVPQQPPMSYKIKELSLQARVVDQVARAQVSQSFVNTGSRQMEVQFVFPLPYDGAVDQLTFMVDGKEYEAKLLPAQEARSIYESYIRRNQDPALLEWIGTGMFKTSVFPVPPGAERTVTLRYSQLLRKDRQLTDFLFPLSTAKYTSQPVEKVSLHATIESSAEIKNVYSPTHSIEITRPDSHHAVVKYEAQNQVPMSDFRLFYDTAAGSLGASVISYRPDANDDGYFLLLASPEIKPESAERPAKTAIFVVDRSGSMSGKKIEQARDALKFVLNNLREGDTFNVVAYDSSVESFRPELQRYNEETRKAALGFVDGIYAGGSTNIDGALSTALGMIQDKSRPTFIVFLTDGLPTAGETNESKIVGNIKQKNQLDARIISFGVGYDVNSRLLDRLSHENFGQSEFVRPDENIETHVARLYDKISSPVMGGVEVAFEFDEVQVEEGSPISRVYPRQVRDLFEGEQLVIAGRYKKAGPAKVTITGNVGAKPQKFDFPAQMTEVSGDQTYAFVEKIWVMRRIGEIIDEIDLHGRNDELVNELVALSTKHGILTPYTSFLADDQAAPRELADTRRGADRARELLLRLGEAEGKAAFAQRAEKNQLKEAATAPQAGGFGGGDFPAPDGKPGKQGAGNAGGVVFRNIDKDEAELAEAVQTIGNETLYKRGKLWIAANAKDVDLEKDAEKIELIERFSDAYFKLTAANTATENAVLARQQAGEELLIKLRGQVYRIK